MLPLQSALLEPCLKEELQLERLRVMQHKSFEGPRRKHNSKLRAACWINQQVRSVNEDSFWGAEGEARAGKTRYETLDFLLLPVDFSSFTPSPFIKQFPREIRTPPVIFSCRPIIFSTLSIRAAHAHVREETWLRRGV